MASYVIRYSLNVWIRTRNTQATGKISHEKANLHDDVIDARARLVLLKLHVIIVTRDTN